MDAGVTWGQYGQNVFHLFQLNLFSQFAILLHIYQVYKSKSKIIQTNDMKKTLSPLENAYFILFYFLITAMMFSCCFAFQ